MSNSLSVSFQYTKEDIFSYVIETLALEKGKCFLFLVFIIFLIILAMVMFLIKAFALAVILLIAAVFFVPAVIFLLYLNLSSLLKLLTDCVFTIEDNKLITASNLGLTTYDLQDVQKVIVTDTVILIYVLKKNAFFIPMRVFSTPEKAQMFVDKLNIHFENP